jgi:RNA 2',3'-cyclic 3'-phosphodiesterase
LRLFLGIELSPEMKEAAFAASEHLRAEMAQAGLRVDARWIPAANLHITLWFIGEVDDARGARIADALKPPFAVAPFTLRAAGFGAFPASGPPRVFWIGVTAGMEPLRDLHRQLEARLTPLGFEPDRRSYSAHLTIARVKDVPRGASPRIRGMLADTPADAGATGITAVTLFRSRLSPKGSTYEPLLRVPLA